MYIGNDLQIAHPSYKIIDDISSGFNGSTTSFALQVSGETPVPFPISTQQVMISVNGVVQEPDPSGSAGFKLLGSNIVFSSAPANGHAFFGVINAGADYVTAGSEFPDGSATAPSFTFQDDQDTGWFRSGSGAVGYSANGAQTLTFDGNGLTVTGDASFVGDSSKNLLWDKSDGQLEFADNAKAVFGTGSDLSIYHDTNNSFISSSTGNLKLVGNANILIEDNNGETLASFNPNSSVDLYHNNVKKFETGSGGIIVQGQVSVAGSGVSLSLADSGKAAFGAGDDLQIYHNGTNTYIDNNTGHFTIRTNVASDVGSNIYLQPHDNEDGIVIVHDGAVQLFYDNFKCFETYDRGITVYGPEGNNGEVYIYADEGDDNADKWRLQANTGGTFNIGNYSTGSWVNGLTLDGSNNATVAGRLNISHDLTITGTAPRVILTDSNNDSDFRINVDGGSFQIQDATNSYANRLAIDSSGNSVFGGTVSDSKGNLRSIPNVDKTSAHTISAANAGRAIYISSGGVTVPNSVMSAGDAVTIINNSGSDQTITQGSGLTIYNTADASTGNRTLAGRGMATIWFHSASTAYISGAGLS